MVLSRSVDVRQGSRVLVALGATDAQLSIGDVVGGPAEVSTSTEGSAVAIDASMASVAGSYTYEVFATGCDADNVCTRYAATVHLSVLALQATGSTEPDLLPHGVTIPSSDRVEEATEFADTDQLALDDEVLVTLREGLEPVAATERAEALATSAGASVTGAFPDLGIFELRWPGPGDLVDRIQQLASQPDVTSAAPSLLGSVGDARGPREWSDAYGDGWNMRAANLPQAWDVTVGNKSEPVGIVDIGVAQSHSDLDEHNLSGSGLTTSPGSHATHVAGIACASEDGRGVVGASWGCETHHAGLVEGASWKSVLNAAESLINRVPVRVVNMSLAIDGDGCVSTATNAGIEAAKARSASIFEPLFTRGRGAHVLWVVAAGNNCATGAASPMGVHAGLDNVVTVASTNEDGSLSSFSNHGAGVEIAAPGGVSNNGSRVRSTGYDGLFCLISPCYFSTSGTSMAAPLVAGVAQLLFSANPRMSVAQAGRCILDSASAGVPQRSTRPTSSTPAPGFGYVANSLKLIDARAAVDCARALDGPLPSDDYPVPAPGRTLDLSRTGRFILAGSGSLAVHDSASGGTDVVSVDSDGDALYSYEGSLSGDGRYVAFSSAAVTTDNPDGTGQVYLHDRQLGTTVLVSRSPGGSRGNSGSMSPRVSTDGRYVVYSSQASNLSASHPLGGGSIYRYDRVTGTNMAVSVESRYAGSGNPAVSADGRYVAYDSGGHQTSAGTSLPGVFVRDTARGTLQRIRFEVNGTELQHPYAPNLSADGRYVVANADDHAYVYDRQSGRTRLLSGGAPMGYSGWTGISGDGKYVLYTSNARAFRGDPLPDGVKTFLVNTVTGTTRLIVADGHALTEGHSLSSDGTRLAVSIQGSAPYILRTW